MSYDQKTADLESERASVMDCLNTALREVGLDAHQVEWNGSAKIGIEQLLFHANRMRIERDGAVEERNTLTAAARDVLDLIESGVLVRDVTRDAEPGWHRSTLDMVMKLAALQAALSKGE